MGPCGGQMKLTSTRRSIESNDVIFASKNDQLFVGIDISIATQFNLVTL